MKIKKLKEQLEKDNNSDLRQLKVTKEEYKKLKEGWLNKETTEFELVCQIELRNQIIKKLINNL